jgi:uncharacterized spore protein YtfJ
MQEVKDFMKSFGDKMCQFAQSDLVIGDKIEIGGVTIVPISRLGIGLGAGGGTGSGDTPSPRGDKHHGGQMRGKGTGYGGGGGVKIRPVAIAVFTASGVEIMPVPDKVGKIEKLLDKIPDLMATITKKKEGEACCG